MSLYASVQYLFSLAKRWYHLRCEQLQMRLDPSRTQAWRQRPRVVVCDRHALDVSANCRHGGLRFNHSKHAGLAQMGSIAQIGRIADLAGFFAPRHIVVRLVYDVVRRFVPGFVRIVGYDQPLKPTGELNLVGWFTLPGQLRNVAIVDLTTGVWSGEPVAIADSAPQSCRSESANPNRK